MNRTGLALGLALVMIAPFAAGQTTGPDARAEDWVISSDVTVSDESRSLAANLTVLEGGRLVLDAVDLRFEVEPGGDRPILRVFPGGELVLRNGTTLDVNRRGYHFVVDGNLTVEGTSERPVLIHGVHGKSGGAVMGQEAAVADGLLLLGNASMTHFGFGGSSATILAEDAERVSLSYCSLNAGTHVPLVSAGTQDLRVDRCEIGGLRTGVFLSNSNATITDSHLTGGYTGFGVLAKNSVIHLKGSEVWDGNMSLRATDGSHVTVERTLFANYTTAGISTPVARMGAPVDLHVSGSEFTPAPGASSGVWARSLGQGIFEDNSAGLHADSGFSFGPASQSLEVRNNTLFANERYGVVFAGVSPVLEGNKFPSGDFSNGIGQAFWFRDLELRVEDQVTGGPVNHARVSLTIHAPGFDGNLTPTDVGSFDTNESDTLELPNAPRRAMLNNGTDLLLPYTVRIEAPGYEVLETTVKPPADPHDRLTFSLVPEGAAVDGGAAGDGGDLIETVPTGLLFVGGFAMVGGLVAAYRWRQHP